MPPPALHTVPVFQPSKQHEPRPDYDEDKGSIRYDRIHVLEPGDDGGARRMERLEPRVEMLNDHVRGSLTVPGENHGAGFEVYVLLVSGSGGTAIPEALSRLLEMQLLGTHVFRPFEGSARVRVTGPTSSLTGPAPNYIARHFRMGTVSSFSSVPATLSSCVAGDWATRVSQKLNAAPLALRNSCSPVGCPDVHLLSASLLGEGTSCEYATLVALQIVARKSSRQTPCSPISRQNFLREISHFLVT